MTDTNYTPEMVATLKAAQPLDLAKAKALGAEMGKGYRSIIAKAKREGFDYISKPHHLKRIWSRIYARLLTWTHVTDSKNLLAPRSIN